MSEKMCPIPFDKLMNWVLSEYRQQGTVFGVHRFYKADHARTLPIFGGQIETPFGPAAGPNSQLAQNLIAAYAAGARFFELKTVQKMDGEDLARCVPRPCILAEDEGYNQEWSTELTVEQARDEYIKAWCALKVLSGILGLGDPNGFVFNMSVGYDLEGIRGAKVDGFIDGYCTTGTNGEWKDEDGKTWIGEALLHRCFKDDLSDMPTTVQFFCSSCDRPLLHKPMKVDEGHRALAEFVKALPCNKEM